MAVYCAYDEIVKIEELKENPKNPNKHSEYQIELLAEVIKKTGWRASITVSTLSGLIVKGHGRLQAAMKAGFKEVPVEFQSFKDDEEEMSALLADNKIAELAEIDDEMLKEIFNEFDFEDLSLTGFSQDEFEDLTELFEETTLLGDPDEVPEEVVTRCKSGDIWLLGNHKLMCGDSTSKADVEKLMNGAKADMVFTDPPYGMKKEKDGVLNDNLNFDDLLEFNRQWIPLTFASLKDNGSWYCWGIDEPLMDIYSNILKPMQHHRKISFRNLLTWDKKNAPGQLSEKRKMYTIADEKCLFVVKGMATMSSGQFDTKDYFFEGFSGIRNYLLEELKKSGLKIKDVINLTSTAASHYFALSQWAFPTEKDYKIFQDYCKGTAFKKEYAELKKEYAELKKEYAEQLAFFDNTHDNMNNVWHFERTSTKEREHTGGHATPKPIALCARAIKSSSRESEIVLDVFGGSGSTLIACEQLNRKCYMMELDPHYCDVIITRWETHTGKSAILYQNAQNDREGALNI